MATNQIRDVTLRPVAGGADPDGDDPAGDASGAGHALFLALDLGDPARLPGFLEEVVARFKHERMIAPPDTRFMLITVIGEVSAAEFAQAWHAATGHDAAARALLGMMQQADVMQGDSAARMIGQASLLANAEPPAA